MAYLDPKINLLLAEKRLFEKNPQKDKFPISPDQILYISIEFKGDLSELEGIGFQTGNVVGNIAFGATNLAGLEALAAHPNVEMICKQQRASIDLDSSIPDIKADQVWTRSGDSFSGHTGKGVIVGIIDTGIDFRHHAFRKSNGQTRILKIWDQTLKPELLDDEPPGEISDPDIANPPISLDYGVEYRGSQIDHTLENPNTATPVRHKDEDGHGTHVAGIAAGDGSQSGHCEGEFTYIGVAPEADLIVVRKWGLTDSDDKAAPANNKNVLIDAISYVLNEAKLAGKPAVINLSLGKFSELMSGTSPISQAIDLLQTRNSTGKAIVFSAGNHAQRNFHAVLSVPENTTEDDPINLLFQIAAEDKKVREIAILYSGSNLSVQLLSPGGKVEWVAFGDEKESPTANGGGKVIVTHTVEGRVDITIIPPPSGENNAGGWLLQFQNTSPAPITLNAFCLYGDKSKSCPFFENDTTTQSTLNEFATGKEVIAVGSYEVGKRLAASSARGPTLDGRTKPEFCAPGVGITSVAIPKDRAHHSWIRKCCCECCQNFYVDNSGTSMAAPHVTGLIALMLSKDPNLTHSEIKTIISDNTQDKPADSTAEEDLGWGSGKVDAEAAVAFVEEVNPALTAVGAGELVPLSIDPFDALYAHFMGTERGPEFFHLFNKYFSEIRELINKNKRVATVWHRCKGPVWVRYAIRAVYSPEITIPKEIDGINFDDGLQRLIKIIKRYASRALKKEIVKYERELPKLREGMTLFEAINWIGSKKPAAAAEAIS